MKVKEIFFLVFTLFFSIISLSSYANPPGFDTNYAKPPRFDTKFFQDIGDIYVSVIVINGDEKEVRELPSDQMIFNTQLTPLEIKQAVFNSFKSQFKDTGFKIYGTGELTETPERLILPEERKDPNAAEVKNLEVLFYIVLTRQLEDSKEIVLGAISSKTVKDQVGRFKKATDLRLEGLSQPFLIFSDKKKLWKKSKIKRYAYLKPNNVGFYAKNCKKIFRAL